MPHDQVVDQAGGCNGLQPPPHVRPAEPARVRFLLDLVAGTDKAVAPRELPQASNTVLHPGRAEVDPTDDPADGWLFGRQGQQFWRLLGDAYGLDDDGEVDPVGNQVGAQVREAEGPAEQREPISPGLVPDVEVPKMLVRVHVLWPGSSVQSYQKGASVKAHQSRWKTSMAGAHHSPGAAEPTGSWHGAVSNHQLWVVWSAAMPAMSAS